MIGTRTPHKRTTGEARRSAGRQGLVLFAFGDFAFNLFWQSAMLFLLFHYTEALELGIATAATIFMVASVWDGVANFAAGIFVDRRPAVHRSALVFGAVPLALSFGLAYLPPLGPGLIGIASLLGAHLLFRTAYAAVNVPYLAMTARISADSNDRAFIAGMRMLFGTAAAVTVALGTSPLGKWLTGDAGQARSFLAAAGLFAVLGAAILVLVGLASRPCAPAQPSAPVPLRAALASVARNRAFVTLCAAMMAMIVAITVLNKSVLYFFKYVLDDPSGGELALASMGIVSAVAVPMWMLLGRIVGLRLIWFVSAAGAMLILAWFAAGGIGGSGGAQMFLIAMQAMIMGLHFTFWAMLPNTIEYGEKTTGVHVEGVVFGLAALLQRVAIGVATAILGWTLGSAGYVANVNQSAATLEAMRWTVAVVPLLFLALSCSAMLLNPLAHGVHRRIVGEIELDQKAAA